MDQISIYIIILIVIALTSALFSKAPIPTSLILVIVGMLLSFVPQFPPIRLKPDIVLKFFLPLLVYQSSALTSWRDVKKNVAPIASMSIGHVFFITFLVAWVIHWLLPQLGWPLAIVLGAVISPPDTVAMVALSEKMGLPQRITTILKGEGLLNDATALILFRIALAAVFTYQFSVAKSVAAFFIIVVGETLYGLIIGFIMGELRLRLRDPISQILFSVSTPFLAYLPPQKLGGSGVLATVLAGSVIGHFYIARFKPEIRLMALSVWTAISFTVESILFLLLGLDFRFVIERISSISGKSLAFYSIAVVLTVIIGRFLWVYPTTYLAELLRFKKKKSHIPWKNLFIVSWAGMRGAVSLAAALAIPALPMMIEGARVNDLLVYLVFCVIIGTLLLQGLALPWVVRLSGLKTRVECEQYQQHLSELSARLAMMNDVLHWLEEYKENIKDNPKLSEELEFHIREYKKLRKNLKNRIADHKEFTTHDEQSELEESIMIVSKIIDVERRSLTRLWREKRISYAVRNKLLEQLDLRTKHLQ